MRRCRGVTCDRPAVWVSKKARPCSNRTATGDGDDVADGRGAELQTAGERERNAVGGYAAGGRERTTPPRARPEKSRSGG